MKLHLSTILISLLAKTGSASYCGCDSCNQEVWDTPANDSDGNFSCGARVNWLQTVLGYDEASACARVGDEFVDGPCGPACDPSKCDPPTLEPTQPPTPPVATFCGCVSCTQEVWDSFATDSDGSFTCGGRINWLRMVMGYDEASACTKVSEEFVDGPCGPVCDPLKCEAPPSFPSKSPTISPTRKPTTSPSLAPSNKPTLKPSQAPSESPSQNPSRKPTGDPTPAPSNEMTPAPTAPIQMCGCTSCTQDILESIADGHSCEGRIAWVVENYGRSEADACKLVADEYPSICGMCHAGHCGFFPPTPTPAPGGMVKVMSYNTEYTGYFDGRFSSFAAHISNVGADVVGLQECQDANGIAAASGYSVVDSSGNGNTILYKANRLEALSSGRFNVPRDEYAQRNISWGKFRIIQGIGTGNEFWFFNTHLPHRHGEAADPNTHSIIAKMLLEKREELGAGNDPALVTGDCNPFASSGASEGSFESNLAASGIVKVHEATGSTGGYAGLDKIFASQDHWTWTNAADIGTGSSDHPAITADLTLKSISPSTPSPTKGPSPPPIEPGVSYCGCEECTQAVWDSVATDANGGSYTCGSRINWLKFAEGYSEIDACAKVSSEFMNGPCGPVCGCNSSPPTTPSTQSKGPDDKKCGGAVDFTNDPNQACETYLWGPTGDDTMPCFAYGGSADPCHLNNNNDQDDGIFKDPSRCFGDTFYLWDEPDTQGRDYSWAGTAWLDYSRRFAQELEQLRSRGTRVTGPLLKAGTSGVIGRNMQTFFDACGTACFDPTDPAYIDIIAINGFCGPWNEDAGCRGGAKFIYDEAASTSSAFDNLPVYITNWSRLQTSDSLDQVDAIDAVDEFFPASGVVKRVYWFGARDYGGGAGTTSYLNNVLPDGRTIGDVWRNKCDGI